VTVVCDLAISVDGFVAGPDQGPDEPLGIGGRKVHGWHLNAQSDVDRRMTEELMEPKGAVIMGRNMFGPIRGEWDEDWRGWWGDDPPYHAPVFVLTHHAREPVPMEGGTTFHFVTDGIDAALEQAREAAGGKDIRIAGGAEAARQYLAAGHIDELHLHIAPVLLGSGERLLDGVGDVGLEVAAVESSPAATHVRYRVTG
jgi:dihydrofolate reductase